MKLADHGLTRRRIVSALLAFGTSGLSSLPDKSEAQTKPPQSKRNRTPTKRDNSAPDDALWMQLPPTPLLPSVKRSGLAKINGTSIFYAQFGDGPPVLMLHGGLANSNYWGQQVAELSQRFFVTVMDTRVHGRSPLTSPSCSYGLYAEDVVALLDFLNLPTAAIVGWSDGAITGLKLAMTRADRVSRLFAFGANVTPDGLKANGPRTKTFVAYTDRCAKEYGALSPNPERWSQLLNELRMMWRTEPNFAQQQLASIKVPTTISDGDHDEIIKIDHTRKIAFEIAGAKLVMMPDVSHFAMLQNPGEFNEVLFDFLK